MILIFRKWMIVDENNNNSFISRYYLSYFVL